MDSNSSSRKENDQPRRRRDWLLLLLALLMSFSCVFCSTQLALLFWPDRLTPASLLTKRQADYRGEPGGSEFDLLDPLVAAWAATDAARLQITPTGAEDDAFTTIARLPATPTPTTRPGPPPVLPQPVTSTPTVAPALDPTTPTSTPNTAVTGTPGTLPTLAVGPVTSTPPSTPLPANTPTLNPTPPPTSIPTSTSPAPTNTPAAGSNPTNTPVPASKPTNASPSTATATPTNTPTPPPMLQISGQVFEDANYAGGNGTALGGGDAGLANVRVELYDGSGPFQSFATTNANGVYTFTVASSGNYIIRVVSISLGDSDTSPLAGFNVGFTSALAEQTYEHDGISGNGGAGALGGNSPISDDTLSATASGIGDTNVVVNISSASVRGVDFGFAYNAVVNTNNTGQGSLRRTLLNTNAIAGRGIIGFAIFGAAPYTIQPVSALPTITDPVIIDGWSQPGWAPGAPIIELDGTNAGVGISGLIITAGSSTVRGLVINRFGAEGISLTTNGGNLIVGNYLGTDATGTSALGNVDDGIDILSSSNIIGGTSAVDRNIISGNNDDGINLRVGATANMVQGNYVGTDVTGSFDVGNIDDGVDLDSGAFNNTVGGTALGAGNVISGNGFEGVNIDDTGTSNNIIQGNFVGTNAAGTLPIPNSECGIYLDPFQTSNTIGGLAAGTGNLIAYNVSAGVCIFGAGDAILSNTILANGGLGIDLGVNGVNINNGTKDSSLANNDMDYPVFTSTVLSGSTLTVSGYVGSAPSQSLFANARVEIFISDNDGSGYGEGRSYLGFLMADANGDFSGSLTVSGLSVGNLITGTATDPGNNTSEFGLNVIVN